VIGRQLAHVPCSDTKQLVLATALAAEIKHFVPLVNQVLSQTERRIVRDESVPATEKVVSIFEPHTERLVQSRATCAGWMLVPAARTASSSSR
jgi:hypothetical protein